MRRNKKRGVYTNRTMKNCPCCNQICTICKGVCKIEVLAEIDPETVAENHPLSKKKIKQHHLGVGSFKRGRIFVPTSKHRKSSWDYGNNFENRHLKKAQIAGYLKEQLEYYDIKNPTDC